MKRFTGTISFLTGIAGLVTITILIKDAIKYTEFHDLELNIIILLMALGTFSVLFYTISTQFWRTKMDEFKKLEYENKVLLKKIEQKELKAKLNEGLNEGLNDLKEQT
jgi:hypothetical protein